MKILLLGKNGQLGSELLRILPDLGQVIALDYPDLDMADPKSIVNTVRESNPDVIFNATAYTNVDRAETETISVEAINGMGPGILAEEARKIGAVLIHYSTDFVFDGKKDRPYIETDIPNPVNLYGLSKLHGEKAVQQAGEDFLILRTSWLYSLHHGGFVDKVLEWSHHQKVLRIVDDQFGSPTWARMLAEASTRIIQRNADDLRSFIHDMSGIYHVAGKGIANRFEWARKIVDLDPDRNLQICGSVKPAKTSDFSSHVRRPLFSGLSCEKFETTFGIELPVWDESLRAAMNSEIPIAN